MSLPSIAILCPSKNDRQFIGTTLLSLAREIPVYIAAGGRVRLCVVNDGSTDETGAIIRSMLRYLPSDTVFVDRAENWGVTRSLEQAFDAVSGGCDLVLRCDADARMIGANWLQTMAEFLLLDEKVGLVAPLMIFPDGTIDCHGVNILPDGYTPRDHNLPFTERGLTIEEVDTHYGAYSMMRCEDWTIDTAYYLWVEDQDQGMVLRQRGKKCFSLGVVQLVHYNRIRALRVSDAFTGSAKPNISRKAKFKEAVRLLAAATLPESLKERLRPETELTPAQKRAQEIDAASWKHFGEKWGFNGKQPDMSVVRAKYAGTEILWQESETMRAEGQRLIRRFYEQTRDRTFLTEPSLRLPEPVG